MSELTEFLLKIVWRYNIADQSDLLLGVFITPGFCNGILAFFDKF